VIPEYIFEGPFSMKLTATDDKPGYVVPEFRVDGDGWQKLLRLADRRQRPVPVQRHGHRHRLAELRQAALRPATSSSTARSDAAGNIATAKRFALTYLDPEKSEVGTATGTVPATLGLTLGTAPAAFGAFTPGLAKDYTAAMSAGRRVLGRRRPPERLRPLGRRHRASSSTARSRCRRR